MKHHVFLVVMLVTILFICFGARAQSGDQECDKDAVVEWIKHRENYSDRFERADSALSNNLTDWRGIPRIDLLAIAQGVRREFENIPSPNCAFSLYFATIRYWTLRIDSLTISLGVNQKRNSQQDTVGYYENYVLPAVYELETKADIDYFAEVGRERPQNDSPNPVLIKTGEIFISNSELKKIISIDSITLPNCNGSSDLSVTQTFTKSSERQVTVRAEGSADIALGIAKAEIEVYASIGNNENMSQSLELTMSAAPGTTVTYEIEWVEVSTAGLLEIIQGENMRFVEFSVPNSLRANIRQPIQTPCTANTITVETTTEAP